MYLRFSLIFTLLFIISLPFEQQLIPNFPSIIAPFFETVSKWVATNLLGWSSMLNYKLESDSAGLYVHCGILIFFCATLALFWHFIERNNERKTFYESALVELSAFYLAMQLFAYGFSKLFKVQFFFPEPNTLFTPLAYLDRDILFWSAMGTSRSYSFFGGLIEIIPAMLLLFPRTRMLGALIVLGVMSNVLMINLGFDISVKVFSAFLIFLTLSILKPDFWKLFSFFFKDHTIYRTAFSFSPKIFIIRSVLCLLLFLNGLYPYLSAGNFNDDTAERPLFHGAYDVKKFIENGVELTPSLNEKYRWKRFFVHRRGYLIVQNMQEQMKDYKLEHDQVNMKLILRDYRGVNKIYELKIKEDSGKLLLSGRFSGKEIYLEAEKVDLKKLPINKNHFHWMVN